MRKHYLSIAMIATMALASCGTENEDVQVLPADGDKTVETPATDKKEQITFKAVYSDGDDGISKTAIEYRRSLVFTAGDDIIVFDGKESSVFTGDISTGTSATCNFTGTADPDAENYYAVYPKSAEKLTASSASATIPDAQDAVSGTFDKNAHVMVASASGAKKEFQFKTANAFIRFTAPRNLKSVVMTGNNGEAIAGNITVSGYSDITVSDASATSITLSGTMEKGEVYYISYAPAKFTKGITLTITDENDKQGTYTTKDFVSNPNQVNNIKAENLKMAFNDMPSIDLSKYLEKFNGEVAEVVLTTYDAPIVKNALTGNPTKKVKLVLPKSQETIDNRDLVGCTNLVSIEMPGVTSIGTSAFEGCTSLAMTSLPEKLNSIGNYAFEGCTSLAMTSLPENLNSIGEYAFKGCTSLALTSLPKNLTSIGNYTFDGCSNLALESLPENLASIGKAAFRGCANLALNSLPEKVTSIESSAFDGCTSLALTSLPKNLTSIGVSAFYKCKNLKLTLLPETVTSIGNLAFYGCTSLALVSLPVNLTSIGEYAFYSCTSLEQITIPSKVTKLGNDAFKGCSSLKSITISGNPEIGDIAQEDDYFQHPNGTVINVSQASYNSNTDYWNYWNEQSNITVNVLP